MLIEHGSVNGHDAAIMVGSLGYFASLAGTSPA